MVEWQTHRSQKAAQQCVRVQVPLSAPILIYFSFRIIYIMNFEILQDLTIRVEDFNLVAGRDDFLSKLRELTLEPDSGMNHELDSLQALSQQRPVQCQILTAYRQEAIVGWALLSRESSDFWFTRSDGYQSEWGALFEVYVDPTHRRQRIGSELIKTAKSLVGNDTLCIALHDSCSSGFYNKFMEWPTKIL